MKNIFKIILTLIIFAVIYFSYWYSNFKKEVLINENKIISIKSWYTIKDLSNELDLNNYFLKKYIKNNKKDFNLLAWRFEIKKDSNIDDLINSLETPLPEKQVKITILEWWNVFDIDEYLYKQKLIEEWKYIEYTQNPEKIEALTEFYPFLNKDFITLEWYLYPDTYSLNYPLKINEFVIKQLDTFETKVYNKILISRNLDNKTIYDVITLSSIVEKEERNDKEKSTVAWILKKRLQSWWQIGADITVCYPYKLTSEECKLVVTKYLYEKNDYNTRAMVWLPKTPIGNPSDITVDATLNDKKTDYWFYLHNVKTWEIHYWKTNAEHESNKKYMR